MTYRGHVKNGTVVLDESMDLPEGAEVQIKLTRKRRKSAPGKALMKFAGKAKDLPADASRNLDHYLYGHTKR